MAFHQPTRQPLQRVIRAVAEDRDTLHTDVHQQQQQASLDESQTWVVFSAATDTSASYLSDDPEESAPTPGRSRFSEFGSLGTIARSHPGTGSRQSDVLSSAIDDESVEDDAELDSLDSHLPDFRTFASAYNQSSAGAPPPNTQILPAHDGLGSFRIDNHLGHEIQDHLYAFERFNPRRTRRRRESLDEAEREAQQAEEQHAEKMQRIEAWRLEHSRILLDEIHKETRRRRQSQSSSRPRHVAEEQKTQDGSGNAIAGSQTSLAWHDEPIEDEEAEEGVFARITRKVIRDIMGIDERLLSILLGEALPEDDDLSSTPKGSAVTAPPANTDDESAWQLKILDRVARELGLLVNQLSPQHPGAFSTYTRMQQLPLPYAGLPVIPEAAAADPSAVPLAGDASAQLPEFKPTVPQATQPVGIPTTSRSQIEHSTQSTAGAFTQEEWEQDLDVKLVFRYLRNRFTPRAPSTPSFTSGTAHLATCSTQDTAAKAARVRQHHPLVGRTRPPAERRQFKATTPASPAAVMRHASSCASQSTRRSARRSSVSSRHYWDIGGSMGTGSVIAPTGPMGSWGEV